MNKVFLAGKVSSMPDLRKTDSGVSVCDFVMAAESGNGDHRRTDYIKIVVWGAAGEAAFDVLKQGSSCVVCGRLQIRTVDKSDKRLYYTEVVSEEIKFM